MRALERSLVTGSAIAPPPRGYPAPILWLGLRRERIAAAIAIEERARGQFAGGLLDEAAGLRARYAEDLPAFSAIGYREAFDVVAGRADLETAIATTVARTRAYAKRQRTWFRSQPDITWLDADEDPASTALAARDRVPPPERRTALCWGEMTRSRTIDLEPEVERAFLIAVETGDSDGWTAEDSLSELASLADTAGAEVVGAEWQHRRHVDPEWYLGKGRAAELATAKTQTGFTLLIADDELRPKQQRALESVVGTKVIDRSGLILDIFAQHARTHEGRLQVELAQLEYQLPRLTRLWTHLSRTQGGIGSRGPGESQLETDRRIIRERIKKLKERVGDVRQQRETAGRSRDRRHVPGVAIVGYTNAGKSSLLNALTGREDVIAEDRLFATLDPTSRQAKLGDGQSVVLTDTVGFIHKLPHQLVDAFRATLEEVNRADVLLEVVDGADPHAAEHRRTVQAVLDELGAGDKPRLVALNKADLLDPLASDPDAPAPVLGDSVPVSALTGFGMDSLRIALSAVLAELWEDVDVRLPYREGELLARIRERGSVEVTYGDTDVHVAGRIAPSLASELRAAAARSMPEPVGAAD